MTITANSDGTRTVQARWKFLRRRVAQYLPALAVATESFVRWGETGFVERLFLAAFAGFVTQAVLAVGFFVAVGVVAWVAGDRVHLQELRVENPWLISALLLAVGGVSFGGSRVDRTVDKIVECVRQSEQSADLKAGIEPGRVIRWCAEEFERDLSDFDPDQ
jgi:hypothetical protein